MIFGARNTQNKIDTFLQGRAKISRGHVHVSRITWHMGAGLGMVERFSYSLDSNHLFCESGHGNSCFILRSLSEIESFGVAWPSTS